MSDSLRSSLSLVLAGTLTNTLTNSLADVVAEINMQLKTGTMDDGTAEDEADKIWASASRTLTSGNNEEIDLVSFTGIDIGAGSAEDPCGNPLTLVEVCAILIVRDRPATGHSTGTLVVGGAASNEFLSAFGTAGDQVKVPPRGAILLFSSANPAYPVSAGNKQLKIAASGGDCTYSIAVLGRSA